MWKKLKKPTILTSLKKLCSILTIRLSLTVEHVQVEWPRNVLQNDLIVLFKLMQLQYAVVMPRRNEQSIFEYTNPVQVLHSRPFHNILPVLTIVINTFNIIQISIQPIHMLNGIIYHNPVRIHDLMANYDLPIATIHFAPFQRGRRMPPLRKKHNPTGGVEGDGPWLAQILLDQDVAPYQIVGTDHDHFLVVVQEIPVPGHPVERHLLDQIDVEYRRLVGQLPPFVQVVDVGAHDGCARQDVVGVADEVLPVVYFERVAVQQADRGVARPGLALESDAAYVHLGGEDERGWLGGWH